MSDPRVTVVTVVSGRYETLRTALDSVRKQSHLCDVIIVDNTAAGDRKPIECLENAYIHHSSQNLGGAGGFALGILLALSRGAEFILLLDDDGRLQSPTYVARAIGALAQHSCDILCPVALDPDDLSVLSFPYGHDYDASKILDGPPLAQCGHLFNGMFARSTTFMRFGVPDIRLFLRGDEFDFFHRVVRSGGTVVTDPRLIVLHPTVKEEGIPMLGDRMIAIAPRNDLKRLLTFRNRGYAFRRHRLWVSAATDFLRYFLFYVLSKRDVGGFRQWLGATSAGIRERLGPIESVSERESFSVDQQMDPSFVDHPPQGPQPSVGP